MIILLVLRFDYLSYIIYNYSKNQLLTYNIYIYIYFINKNVIPTKPKFIFLTINAKPIIIIIKIRKKTTCI
jgi:hypothetical protein